MISRRRTDRAARNKRKEVAEGLFGTGVQPERRKRKRPLKKSFLLMAGLLQDLRESRRLLEEEQRKSSGEKKKIANSIGKDTGLAPSSRRGRIVGEEESARTE